MSLLDFNGRLTPETRVTAYYFFAPMSIGAVNAFAGIWFGSLGLLPAQIGIINATPLALVLLIGFLVGRLADRADDWRRVIVIGSALSGIIPIGLFFSDGFWSVLFVWTFGVTTQMSILPIVDAAAMRMSRRRGSDFSIYYAWKTIGYLLMVFISGLLIAHFGTPFFLPLFVGLSLLRGLMAQGLPKFRDPHDIPSPEKPHIPIRRLMTPWFVLPLLAWSMVHCTHFVLNGFLGLLWLQQGLSPMTIGLLIAASGIPEAALFFAFKRFAAHFSPRVLILGSTLAGVVRWGILSTAPGVEILFLLQFLNAFTYALGFLACTNFIADRTSHDIAAQAQSFFTTLQYGIAILALLGFGWLAEIYGATAFLASAAIAALGGLLVLASFILDKEALSKTGSDEKLERVRRIELPS